MNAPLVSICIPTHNRSRYLASLLESLVSQLADFPYEYELVIADNASGDDTPAVIEGFSSRLPIRAVRHHHNIGGYPNWQFVMSHAWGRYLVYLSDDDSLLGEPLAAVIAKLEADPALGVVYAPWLLYDLVAQQAQGQFYSVPRDLRVEQGAHGELLDHLLRRHIFPEIAVVRRELFAATQPRVNQHAFLAFMHSADYLSHAAVLIQTQPFYVSITRYFEDETREQLGADEVEVAWDRYRGGLDYLLAKSGKALSAEERQGLQLRIQALIAERMCVAIRLRHAKQRCPIDSYYLAMRVRGMGYERLLPVPLDMLASHAMLHFLLSDAELHRGMRQLLWVGDASGDERSHMQQHCTLPVEYLRDLEHCEGLSNTLVFVRDDAPQAMQLRDDAALQRGVRLLRERDLVAKFGG